jgi:hypothetical protein
METWKGKCLKVVLNYILDILYLYNGTIPY